MSGRLEAGLRAERREGAGKSEPRRRSSRSGCTLAAVVLLIASPAQGAEGPDEAPSTPPAAPEGPPALHFARLDSDNAGLINRALSEGLPGTGFELRAQVETREGGGWIRFEVPDREIRFRIDLFDNELVIDREGPSLRIPIGAEWHQGPGAKPNRLKLRWTEEAIHLDLNGVPLPLRLSRPGVPEPGAPFRIVVHPSVVLWDLVLQPEGATLPAGLPDHRQPEPRVRAVGGEIRVDLVKSRTGPRASQGVSRLFPSGDFELTALLHTRRPARNGSLRLVLGGEPLTVVLTPRRDLWRLKIPGSVDGTARLGVPWSIGQDAEPDRLLVRRQGRELIVAVRGVGVHAELPPQSQARGKPRPEHRYGLGLFMDPGLTLSDVVVRPTRPLRPLRAAGVDSEASALDSLEHRSAVRESSSGLPTGPFRGAPTAAGVAMEGVVGVSMLSLGGFALGRGVYAGAEERWVDPNPAGTSLVFLPDTPPTWLPVGLGAGSALLAGGIALLIDSLHRKNRTVRRWVETE